MGNSIFSLIFPPKCVFCQRLLAKDELEVCKTCLGEIELDINKKKATRGAFFDNAISPFVYENDVRQSLQRFKFSGKQSYAKPFARMMSFAIEHSEIKPCDIIVFVPTNNKNLRKRGYGHTELLAKELSKFCGIPVLDALRKTRKTQPMFGLKPEERRANILNAIALKKNCDVSGKSVLLVDDILTTGATASECAAVLKLNGAKYVCVVTVAATRKK